MGFGYRFWSLLVILFIVFLVFRDFFVKGLLPVPSDILVGAYYPWLDSKWEYVVGVPVKNPLPSDVISIIYPWRILGIEMIKAGILPLWDPSSLLGVPLLANFQAALLNPVNILFFLMPPQFAWSIQIILQPLLISGASFLFLRSIGLSKFAALFGALSFSFSGFSIVWMEYNTIGYTLVFFPLILLLVEKIIQTRKLIFSFILGLVIAIQLFSGYPQISIFSLVFGGLYFLYRLSGDLSHWPVKATLYGIGLISGIALSAVQLLPGLEALSLSIRFDDVTASAGSIQFLPFKHILTLFIPDFFGNPATGNYWGSGSYDNFAFSLPIVTLFLFIIGLLTKATFVKRYLIFYIFILLSLLLATDNSLSHYLISERNFLGLKSAVAARILFVFDLSATVLAAKQLNELIINKRYRFFELILPIAILMGIIGGLLLSKIYLSNMNLSTDNFLKIGENKYPDIGFQGEKIIRGITTELNNHQIALRNSLIPFVTMLFTAISFIFIKFSSRIFLGIIFILLILGIMQSTNKYIVFTPARIFYPETEVITTLKNNLGYHRFDKERGEIFPSNTWYPYGLKAASGQNTLVPLLTAKYMVLINNEKLGQYSRYIDIADPSSVLYDTLDVKYIAVINRNIPGAYPDKHGEPFGKFLTSKFKEFYNFGTVRIIENTTNLGLGWFSQNTECMDSEDEIVKKLFQKNYNPRKLMLINCSDINYYNESVGYVAVVKDLPLFTQFKVSTPKENFLNISKAFYPGWQAFVDGEKTTLYKANLALTAVKVPKGEHIVELKYQPESFKIGLVISLLSLIILVGFGIVSFIKKRQQL